MIQILQLVLRRRRLRKEIEKNIKRLIKEQYKLYAENKRALLIVLQGMDTSGKDGVIRHVMSGINPQGCTVTSFKAPSSEELDHDFLWRIHKAIAAKKGIYRRVQPLPEDVLIVRVKKIVSKDVWKTRFEQINEFEEMLTENGVVILKFFLHISKDEQKKLEARLKDSKKLEVQFERPKGKGTLGDYMKAYEDALGKCSTKNAPWFVIPSNKKWFRNLAISEIIDEKLESMNFRLPQANIRCLKGSRTMS